MGRQRASTLKTGDEVEWFGAEGHRTRETFNTTEAGRTSYRTRLSPKPRLNNSRQLLTI